LLKRGGGMRTRGGGPDTTETEGHLGRFFVSMEKASLRQEKT